MIHSVAISPDSHTIISGSNCTYRLHQGKLVPVHQGSIGVWDVKTGTLITMLEGHTGPVECIRFTPDGKRFVSSSGDNTIMIWDAQRLKCIGQLEGHTDSVLSVSITHDGKGIVSGSEDRTLRLWQMDQEEPLAIYQTDSAISSVSGIGMEGHFAFSTYTEDVVFMTCPKIV